MTTVPFDTYFPFEEAGRQASMARWRRMGRLWLHNGVVQGVGAQFGLVQGWNPAEGRILVSTGAAVIEGFYGETANWTWVATPGNDGMVKVRLEGPEQRMSLFYENWHAYHDDPWAAHGVVETPLWEVWPDGRFADRRLVVSPDVVEGLETIPDEVPWGYAYALWGPTTAVDLGVGGNAVFMALDWMADLWAPGRTYQVAGFARATQGPTAGAGSWVHLRALAYEGPVVKESRLVTPLAWMTQPPTYGWGEFILPQAPDLYIAVQVASGNPVHFEPYSCYIEVADLGRE